MALTTGGLSRRVLCLLYEGLAVFAVLLAGFLFPQIVLSGFGFGVHGKGLWLHIFALLLLYFLWCWLNGGQTLAMKTWKLRLVGENGKPIRPAQALLRYCLAWPCILLGGIGVFWALMDREGQMLHDRLAGTRIIAAPDAQTSPPEQPQ